MRRYKHSVWIYVLGENIIKQSDFDILKIHRASLNVEIKNVHTNVA